MVDVFTKEKRSEIMSRIRSKSGLDRRLFTILDSFGIRYRKYPKAEGSPDAQMGSTMVFAQGCFWHGCPQHFKLPKSSFSGVDWGTKIERNRRRDRAVNRRLKGRGFRVLRIWEHDLKRNPEKAGRLLLRAHRMAYLQKRKNKN